MSVYFLIFLIFLSGYCLFSLVFILTLRIKKYHTINFEPKVSIIVAVRNEALTLTSCLNSLVNLDYPRKKLEIIVIDDHSRDNSEIIIQKFCDIFPHFKLISLTETEKIRPGKAGAVLKGLEESSGEIICLTDGDCQVSTTWLKSLLSGFTPETGVVGGFTILANSIEQKNRLANVQALDWIYLLAIAAASSKLGIPLSWVGNNLAFRRCVYDEIGGYMALGDSLIEDFSFLKAVAEKTNWKMRFEISSDSVVYSQPELPYRRFYQQRKRWAAGIFQVKLFGKILILVSSLTHVMLVSTFFIPQYRFVTILGIFVKLLADFILIFTISRKLGKTRLLYNSFWGFELHYLLYTTILPFFLLFDRQIEWKDRKYNMTASGIAIEP